MSAPARPSQFRHPQPWHSGSPSPRHSVQIRFLEAHRILRRRIPANRIGPIPTRKMNCSGWVPNAVTTSPKSWRSSGQGHTGYGFTTPARGVSGATEGSSANGKQLGHAVGATTVKRNLAEHGVHTTPEKHDRKHQPMPWPQFIHAHMVILLACDFFTKPVYALRGRSALFPGVG